MARSRDAATTKSESQGSSSRAGMSPPESPEHRHMSDERGEHHYPDGSATEAELRARRERDELKQRLERGPRSNLRKNIKRSKP
jgi:hypothetical protein